MKIDLLEGFQRPFGACAAPDGAILVCDLKASLISRRGRDGANWDRAGDPPVKGAHSVVAAPDGAAYATDYYGRRIVRVLSGGRIEEVARPSDARPWLLTGPAGIAFDPEGRLVVGDYGADCLLRYSTDGEFLGWLGAGCGGWSLSGAPSKSSDSGGFDRLHAALFMPDGTMLVADSWNHRLQRFDAGGRWIESLGAPGWAPGRFLVPVALCAWDGGFVVSEYGNQRLQSFDARGRLRGWLGASAGGAAPSGWRTDGAAAERGSAPGAFWRPYDVKSDGSRLIVADTDNSRVQIIDFAGAA